MLSMRTNGVPTARRTPGWGHFTKILLLWSRLDAKAFMFISYLHNVLIVNIKTSGLTFFMPYTYKIAVR